MVLAIGGVSSIARLRRALTRTGTLAIVGGENGATWSSGIGRQLHAMLLNPFVSRRLTMVANKTHFSGLERLTEHALDGTVALFMDRPFDLSATADAIRHLLAGKARRKVVITV